MTDLTLHADIISTHILMDMPHDEDLGDLTLEEAYDLSDLVADRLETPLGGFAGYKIAWNVPALMEKFGMPHPGFGRVFKSQVHHMSAHLKLENYRNFMFEPEIVAVLGKDLKPGEIHTAESVADAVAGFAAGFELLDRRDFPVANGMGPQILGHNVFNAGAIVGAERVKPERLSLEDTTTRVQVNAEMLIEEVNAAPQHPLEAIAFLAQHYCGRGRIMKAGQIILCGSHTPLQPVTEASRISVAMGRLGAAEIDIR